MIVIVDFGSQTADLIQRRMREFGVNSKKVIPQYAFRDIKRLKPAGIILSGGPAGVYEKDAPKISRRIFDLGIPILGICYGWQLMAKVLRGKVVKGNREYGPTKVRVIKKDLLISDLKKEEFRVWMSHGDEVIVLPEGFERLISSEKVKFAGVGDEERKFYGVQFHPEVEHTQKGKNILRNFVKKICGLKTFDKQVSLKNVIDDVKRQIGCDPDKWAIAAVSGGVDSAVAAAIIAKVMGKRFVGVYCDNGLMREGTKKEVEYIFHKLLKTKLVVLRCKDEFLDALKGVTDPEKKRVIIGKLYIKLFEQEAKKHGKVGLLVQGTIYSDVIESQGSRHASHIKSHHNVGGLPKKMGLSLLEPLRNYYKDEVRELGRQLRLPASVLTKQPFPGPGQAIRILGEVTSSRLKMQNMADEIVLEEIKKAGFYNKVFQSFPVLTGAMSTAVKGDGRAYGEVVALRVYDSSDIMTAGWTKLPYEVMQKISSRIVNEVKGVSRVVYDITSKPPATMEWE